MGERAGGLPLPESYALRAALKRGLDELEAELAGKASDDPRGGHFPWPIEVAPGEIGRRLFGNFKKKKG